MKKGIKKRRSLFETAAHSGYTGGSLARYWLFSCGVNAVSSSLSAVYGCIYASISPIASSISTIAPGSSSIS